MGRKIVGFILIGILLTLLGGCTNNSRVQIGEEKIQTFNESETNKMILGNKRVQSKSQEVSEEEKREMKIRKYMEKMTVEEKIGQLFFVTVQQAKESVVIRDKVGGIVLFKQDITTKEETIALIESLQTTAAIPLWIGIDEEGGRVSRLGNNKEIVDVPFMSAKEIGESKDVDKAYNEAKRMGKVLSSLGINMDFAPVADIFNNPLNTVIGDRSFGTKKEEVVPRVIAFAKGLKEEKVEPVIKHFPGHGNTSEDSHKGLAYANKSIKELEEEELVPFFEAVDKGIDIVMVGHIVVPEMDELPATLSAKWGEYIRQKFNKREVIFITDAMNMGAIVESGEGKKVILDSFLSGIDVILMPEQLDKAVEYFKEAYETGVLTDKRLNESVEKILLKKAEQNLLVLE